MFLATATMAQPKPEEKKANDQSPFEPTNESQIIFTKDDVALIEKMKTKYADKLDAVQSIYPNVLQRFVIGYAHEEDRANATFEHFDLFLDGFDSFKLSTILDEPLENEETMFNAWPLYIYGTIQCFALQKVQSMFGALFILFRIRYPGTSGGI